MIIIVNPELGQTYFYLVKGVPRLIHAANHIVASSTRHQGSPFMEQNNVEYRAESVENDVSHGEGRL